MDWKTIESAPRDYSDVLLHDPDLLSDWRTVCEGYFDAEQGMWRSPAFGHIKPTHWRALPPPPRTED